MATSHMKLRAKLLMRSGICQKICLRIENEGTPHNQILIMEESRTHANSKVFHFIIGFKNCVDPWSVD